jgi:hypothetical protein
MWSDGFSSAAPSSRQPCRAVLRSTGCCANGRTRWVCFPFAPESFIHIFASDTRVLLTHVDNGKVTPMTENHHPDTRIEAHRLRRTMGSGLILDSFGEAR